MDPLLEVIQVLLVNILSLRHVNHNTQLGVLCKLALDSLGLCHYEDTN